MELESRNGNSCGDPILDASTADPHSHQQFLRAGAAALLALSALSIPIHAAATTTVFAPAPPAGARSITAAPTGFPGSYLVTDGNNSVGNGSFGDIVVLNGRGQEVATFDEGSIAQPFSPNGLHFAVINGVTELLATNGGQIDAITASSFKPTGTAAAPEIDPASAAGALTLLLGTLAVLRSGRVLD
jgi:hypothetical protein